MEQNIDASVLNKIQKLLNLAKDGGATEGEAAAAMEKAQAIMAENNLTMATMEASGKSADGKIDGAKRTKTTKQGKALYKYQQRLMATVAYTNFCAVMITQKWNGKRYMDSGYVLVGREANVAAAYHEFDYLNASLERILTPFIASNSERLSRKSLSFKEGAATRLGERLYQRHAERLREQAEDARAHATENALVVIMEDYAQTESDFNNDLANGWESGTTARRREESAIRQRAWKAKEDARRANLTDAQRLAEDRERDKNLDKWRKKSRREHDKFWKGKDQDAYFRGYTEANKVGLDDQITRR